VSDALLRAAEDARRHAHAPYSRYLVGAAVEAEDGRIYAGCNVENASYGLTICAERAAVCAAVVAGARRIRRAVVVTDSDPPGAPCGACRQVLAEFGLDMEVVAVGPSRRMQWSLRELLPSAFTAEVLR
jgi:cytidine deaminase